jgi:hypothetical protein
MENTHTFDSHLPIYQHSWKSWLWTLSKVTEPGWASKMDPNTVQDSHNLYYQGVVSFHEAFQYERSAIHVLSGVTETTCMSMIRHRADSRYIVVSDNDYKSCTIIVSLDSQLLESYRVDKHFRVTSNQHFQSRGIRNGCAVAMRYTAMLRCITTSDRPFWSWLHWSPYPPWCPCCIVSVKLKHNVQRLVTSFEPLAVESTKMTNWWLWLGISSGGSLAQQPLQILVQLDCASAS